MCLIIFAYNQHPEYRLILAANRDEFYERPTRPAAFWPEAHEVLAGKDLQAGGTWMGITRKGRFAAITNYRDPGGNMAGAESRGRLVKEYLTGQSRPQSYLENIDSGSTSYNGFNLLAGDTRQLYCYSNRERRVRKLKPGIYGLSNRLLDTPWPKVTQGKSVLSRLISDAESFDGENLFSLLADRSLPDDSTLPDTGVGLEWERILAPFFIQSVIYGTRSSSIILIDRLGQVTFTERTYDPHASQAQPPPTRSFTFTIEQ